MSSAIFTGSTKECLAHFVEQAGGYLAAIKAYQVDYPRTARETMYCWFHGDSMPQSAHMIRVQSFLERRGYQLAELRGLTDEIRLIRHLIDRDVWTLEQVRKELDYNKNNQVNDFLAGKIGNTRGLQRIGFDKLVAKAKALDARPTAAVHTAAAPATKHHTAHMNGSAKADVMTLFVGLVHALKPMADTLLSDAFTAEDREAVRDQAGKDAIFQLKNTLSGLCGERARKHQQH